MTKPVEFPQYEGQPNYPTWVTMLVIDNDQDAQEYYRTYARLQGLDFVKGDITEWTKEFTEGSPCESHHTEIVSSWINYSVRRVDWTLVHEALADRPMSREADEFTEVAIEVMRGAPWQDIVKGFEYHYEADTALRDWLLDRVDTWISTPVIRKGKRSKLALFCNNVYEICLAVVDWQVVYEDFSEEL